MAVNSINVQQALELQAKGITLIDIREPSEWQQGIAAGAMTVSRADLEANPCRHLSSQEQSVMLICAGGARSTKCAEILHAQGYRHISSVNGGTQAWEAAGLPMQAYTASDYEQRYARQMILPNVGRQGQDTLARSRVVIVGAGGLGSPCAFYLAAAGVGELVLIDNDTVALSNLQRQILHSNKNIGEKKVISAKSTLNALNPSIRIECHDDAINSTNARNYFNNCDLVIDGTDNFASRYAINDACAELGIPWLFGAVYRFEGQLSLIHANSMKRQGPCYRCLFPEAETNMNAPNCMEAGVLGVAPGVIGLLQATEALKYLLGIGESLRNRLLSIDLLSMRIHESRYLADRACKVCNP
jgi:molybdopterin/thiamine biosynthesis adenylyltransferase/rhodanese-related sulfurtransferase